MIHLKEAALVIKRLIAAAAALKQRDQEQIVLARMIVQVVEIVLLLDRERIPIALSEVEAMTIAQAAVVAAATLLITGVITLAVAIEVITIVLAAAAVILLSIEVIAVAVADQVAHQEKVVVAEREAEEARPFEKKV